MSAAVIFRNTAFVTCDDAVSRQKTTDIAADIGFEKLDAGHLCDARYLDMMTHINIYILVTEVEQM